MKEIIPKLEKLAKLVRYFSLVSTSEAGSGHPSSSLSSADLMTALFFEEFRFDLNRPEADYNDRLIFSKGHASPLFYSLYAAAGVISKEEILRLRKIDSPLEGHPTPAFKYTEAATGSLGQGLSVGVGMALNGKYLDKLDYRVFVLLGDGEMAEGSVWEAIELASYYKLNNLIGILDVNRLGQSGETMLGYKLEEYKKRISAFGWETIVINGHNLEEILNAFQKISTNRPTMIIAKTVKGKGVSFLENKDGWHGKALPADQLITALKELGEIDKTIIGAVKKPESPTRNAFSIADAGGSIKNSKLNIPYKLGEEIATREAYGDGLVKLGELYPEVVVLDGDVKNSTYSEKFKEKFPERFFEMFIAEQNMVGSALGMSKRGKIPFASTFSAFFTRAFDQIRMAALSQGNIKLCGSHAGVSIGEDGASQMGLEDLAMMRTVFGSTVLYPSDAVSTFKLVLEMAKLPGINYLRTTRGKTAVIYENDEKFPVGVSKVHSAKQNEKVTVVAAGITVHEALAAQKELAKEGIGIRVIDCYSIKPIDIKTLKQAAKETKAIITVEDHWSQGGLGDAVLEALSEEEHVPVYKLAVKIMPHSGKPQELLEKAGIDRKAIMKKVKEILP